MGEARLFLLAFAVKTAGERKKKEGKADAHQAGNQVKNADFLFFKKESIHEGQALDAVHLGKIRGISVRKQTVGGRKQFKEEQHSGKKQRVTQCGKEISAHHRTEAYQCTPEKQGGALLKQEDQRARERAPVWGGKKESAKSKGCQNRPDRQAIERAACKRCAVPFLCREGQSCGKIALPFAEKMGKGLQQQQGEEQCGNAAGDKQGFGFETERADQRRGKAQNG